MTNSEKHWQNFIASGNPMSYIAYRQQAKKDDLIPRGMNATASTRHEDL
ncbi:MAG: hypothetical protein FWB88_00175 [Defluviitaleaceae bacterium]|nr:hypothetical protein [Defluviitaleaceae bacterium]MCL2239118.1 hypothetical protein [Defluviitaleaceae bacterium]